MHDLKFFRSIKIKAIDEYKPDNSGSAEVLRVEGWAYKYKTETGKFIIDADQESINTDNIDLLRYSLDTLPVLFSHDKDKIIGKVVDISKQPEGLKIVADLYHFPDDALSAYVVNRVKAGLISAFSVGVLVKDYTVVQQDGEDYLQANNSEIIEVSLVSVPANAHAIFNVIGHGEQEMTLGVSKSALKEDNPNICDEFGKCATVTKAIKNTTISTKPWGDVDKTELAHKVQRAGINYIKEAYLYVGDPEQVSTYKLPHHEMVGNDLVVNKNGVEAAYASLQGSRGNKPDLTAEQEAAARNHLLKHYKEMLNQGLIDSIPEGLKDLKGNDKMVTKEATEEKGTEEVTKNETSTETAEEETKQEEGVTSNGEEVQEEKEDTTKEETVEEEKKEEKEEKPSEPEKTTEKEEENKEKEEEQKEPEEEKETSLEDILSYLGNIDVTSIDDEKLESVYEVVSAVAEKIESRVLEELKATLEEMKVSSETSE